MLSQCVLNMFSEDETAASGAAVTGNSHHPTSNSTNVDGDVRNNKHAKDAAPAEDDDDRGEGGGGGGGSHDKSVLQAKLTKLAIQIGYAGMFIKF